MHQHAHDSYDPAFSGGWPFFFRPDFPFDTTYYFPNVKVPKKQDFATFSQHAWLLHSAFLIHMGYKDWAGITTIKSMNGTGYLILGFGQRVDTISSKNFWEGGWLALVILIKASLFMT